MKNSFYIVFLLGWPLILVGCAEPNGVEICEENGEERACTPKERHMIEVMHFMINYIAAPERSSVSDAYFWRRSEGPDPSVLFFGENHVHITGQLETLAAMNALARPNDVLLLEGNQRGKTVNFDDCARFLLYRVFVNSEYRKVMTKYSGTGALELEEKEGFRQLYRNTRKSYDLNGLGLTHLTCEYWDDVTAMGGPVNYSSMRLRNRSMKKAIADNLSRGKRVLINAGSLHLYLGERLNFFRTNATMPYHYLQPFINDQESFYRAAKIERLKAPKDRNFSIDNDIGSSKTIFKWLINQRIFFQEIISKAIY